MTASLLLLNPSSAQIWLKVDRIQAGTLRLATSAMSIPRQRDLYLYGVVLIGK